MVKRNTPAIAAVVLLSVLLFFAAAHYSRLIPASTHGSQAAPDEAMRQELCEWIYENSALPVGNEPELVDNAWGYSYAFTAYLPAMLSALVMRLAPAGINLLHAARLVSVFSYALLAIYAYLLGRELFQGAAVWCFTLVSVSLPQAFFCGLYLNNDIVSLLSCYMIAFCMVSGKRKGWTAGSCIHLGISLAVCALSYYFAYGWIAAATIWCLADGKRKLSRRDLRRRALLAAGTVFLLAGWYFIRNVILYNGDLFGMSAQHRQAEIEAAAGREIHFGEPGTLTWENLCFWIKYSCRSFFAGFRAMDAWASDRTYTRIHLWLLVGTFPGLVYYAGKGKRLRGAFLLFLIGLPVLFSLYRSFTYDWQYQGRYLFSAWPTLCILITNGYLQLGRWAGRLLPEKTRSVTEQLTLIGASACFVALSVHTVIHYLLPLYTGL